MKSTMHEVERSVDEHSVPTIHDDGGVVFKRVELRGGDERGIDYADLVVAGTVARVPLSFHGIKKRLSDFDVEVLGEYFRALFS